MIYATEYVIKLALQLNPEQFICSYKHQQTMGQQHRKETKRRRRSAYIKRQKEIAKNSANTAPVQLATKVVKADAEPAKKAPAKKKAAED